MSELRDKVENKIAEELWNHECGHIATKWSLLAQVYKLHFLNRAKKILEIPSLAVVNREDKSLAQLLYMNTTAEELSALGFVREVKE